MKTTCITTVALCLILTACVSPEARRDQERGYVRTSNEMFERADGGGNTKLVGIAKEMGERATALFPEVEAAVKTAKKERKKVTIPRVISAVPPSYPLMARIFPAEGEVWVAFVVGVDGSVDDAKALIDPDSSFSKAAVKAVMQWKFTPGSIAGSPARLLLTVPVRFELMK